MNYGLNYKEKHELNESDITITQRTLYFIVENMRIEKSIDEDSYKLFKQAIKALEYIRWIPCNERPPKESGNYLVTFGGTHLIGIDFYSTEEDARRDFEEYYEEYIGWRSHNVLAWQLLPKPYKESEK